MKSPIVARPRFITSHASLRGLAAICIVFYHLTEIYPGGLWYRSFAPFSRGYLFVEMFFILSGFVIAYVYVRDRTSPMSMAEIGKFLRARFVRLFPLNLFVLAALVVIGVGIELFAERVGLAYPEQFTAKRWHYLGTNLLLVQAWDWAPGDWNFPAWSVSTELQVYFAFPLMLYGLLKFPRLTVLALSIVAVTFFGYVWLVSKDINYFTQMGIVRCLAGFCLGVLIYRYRHWPQRLSETQYSWLQMITLGGMAAVFWFSLNDAYAVLPFVALTMLTWEDRGALGRALNQKAGLLLGELSYAIYLVHTPVINTLWPIYEKWIPMTGLPPQLTAVLWVGIVLLLVLWLAFLLHIGVEKPVGRWYARRKAKA